MTHVLELSRKAQDFYENAKTKNLHSGYEKNVLVRADQPNCVFVKADYIPQPGDVIFRCQTINQNTRIDLHKIAPGDDLRKIALKNIFTRGEWEEILNNMNNVILTPELDPRDEIAEELEGDLAKKIRSLCKTDGFILLWEIERFWNDRLNFGDFVKNYV